MTGFEQAAATAAQTAGKALKSGGLETAALLEEAKGSPELRHAAQQRAQRLAIRETLINRLYAPIGKLLGMRADYFDGPQFGEDLARKTAHLADDEVIAPKANVAAQAMQGLGFSLDEPDLKEMYLNLLATASTKSRAQQAHPAFAEIIRQLTPAEAAALAPVLAPGARPICRIHRAIAGSQGNTITFNHYLDQPGLGIGPVDPQELAAWVDNWIRLGLVEVAYDRYLTAAGVYAWIDTDRYYQGLLAQSASYADRNPEQPKLTWGTDHGILLPTAFGSLFRNAAMSFETPDAALADLADPSPRPDA